ncbi:MAG: hypothetical protein GY819_14385, partial [Planctomycetaceae bacterium]|nr:hypothetical protein [Planctomycetaceae bacterium]
TVEGTDGNGCKNTDDIVITVITTPTVSVAGTTTVCNGENTILTASGADTYTWSPATGLSATTGSNVTANPTTTTTYTVTGLVGTGCSGSTDVTITVNTLPTVSITGNTEFCKGIGSTLTASGADTYTWSPATGLSATTGTAVTASITADQTYTVTGTDANGCQNTDNIAITVNALPNVSVAGDTEICNGESSALTASGADTYTWSPATSLSATTGNSVTASPTADITYTVTGTDGNGCQNTDNIAITVIAAPTVSVAGTTTVCNGENTILTASGADTYTWSPATGLSATTGTSVTASPTADITYTVEGTDG